jgi:hypothetical protein
LVLKAHALSGSAGVAVNPWLPECQTDQSAESFSENVKMLFHVTKKGRRELVLKAHALSGSAGVAVNPWST